jgi:Putative Ig domain
MMDIDALMGPSYRAQVPLSGATSGTGQTLSYSATGLPAGLTINSSTGLISGTPTSQRPPLITGAPAIPSAPPCG